MQTQSLRRVLTVGSILAASLGVGGQTAFAASTISFLPFAVVAGPAALVPDAGAPAAPDFDQDGFTDQYGGANPNDLVFGGPNLTTQTIFSPGRVVPLSAGDFNGDGRTDLLLKGSFSSAAVDIMLPGAGAGQGTRAAFGQPIPIVLTGGARTSIVVYDANLDGVDDVFAYDPVGITGSQLYFGSASGAPLGGPAVALSLGASNVVRAADLNKDGYLDLIVASFGPGALTAVVYEGGNGGYTQGTVTYPGSTAIELGDVNSDGLLDFRQSDGKWAVQIQPLPVVVPEAQWPTLLVGSAAALTISARLMMRKRRAVGA
jgi:FG-GAP-like repeat